MSTSVLEHRRTNRAACAPAVVRIGLLGAGNVGAAFARLASASRGDFAAYGFTPVVTTALVRSTTRQRSATSVSRYTADADEFFARPHDLIVEALGGVEPARCLVHRALDRGIPVVTANKSLVAACGDELAQLARRRATAFRYEAACIAGVPFLGTFERRPLASRVTSVAGVLNGTSNYILTAMARDGVAFTDALADAQRLGLAEPNPDSDIRGIDAAEKLTILLRQFGALNVPPSEIPLAPLDRVERADLSAASAFGGAIRPIAIARWDDHTVRAFAGPAFVDGAHPFAAVAGLTNGIQIRGARGTLCFTGPGAGPDVTAATLVDDVAEIVTERRIRPPASVVARAVRRVERPETAWFVRVSGAARNADAADLLSAYGVWCTRLSGHAGRLYALTCAASHDRVESALSALRAATGHAVTAFPALGSEEAAC